MKKLLATLTLFVALAAPSFAQSATPAASAPAVPDIVTKGFDAYKTSSQDAVDIWFKGSPLNDDMPTKAKLLTAFLDFEKAYGKYLGYEIFKFVPLTKSTGVAYAVLKYEKGPIWFSINLYKPADTWIIPTLNVNQNPQAVLPQNLLGGQ
ncbi:MAG TPA: hypothetical protein VK737_07310 [Opitutales bacterium]|nr:hypothetical protein [Opitutales bacterium]